MTAMATHEDHSLGSAGPGPRLPTLPVADHPQHRPMDTLSEKGMAAVVAEVNGIDGSASDRLPVVEITPFSHRQWQPSRSLPHFYDRSATSMSNSSNVGNKGGSFPDPAALGLLQQQKATEFGSRSSLNGERRDALRPRLREGKPMDISHPGTFISAIDREKTTIEDMNSSTVQGNQPFICLHKSFSESDMLRRREMRVQGKRMEDMPPKLSMFYVSPWEYYRMHRPYNIPAGLAPGGPTAAQKATSIIDELEMRYEALENVYIDDSIYDTFDRSNTLPSIRVTNAPTRRKRNRKQQRQQQQQQQQQSQESTAMSTGSLSAPTSSKSPVYRLGVANSLDVLRHFGRPARVENHLTTHLKHTLNQLRRTQDPQATLSGLAMGPLQAPLAAVAATTKPVGLRTSGAPTLGEDMIKAGIANNAKKPVVSSRNIRAALPSKSAPDVLSRPTTHVRSEIYGNRPGLEGGEDGLETSRTTILNGDNNSMIASGHKERTVGGDEGKVSSAKDYQSLADNSMPPLSAGRLLSNSGKQLISPLPQENNWIGKAPTSGRKSRQALKSPSKTPSSIPGGNALGHDQVPGSSDSQGRRSRVTIKSPRPNDQHSNPPSLNGRGTTKQDEIQDVEEKLAAPTSSPTEDPSSAMLPTTGEDKSVAGDDKSTAGDKDPIQIPQATDPTPAGAVNQSQMESQISEANQDLLGEASGRAAQESRREERAQSSENKSKSDSSQEIDNGSELVAPTGEESGSLTQSAATDKAVLPGEGAENGKEAEEGNSEQNIPAGKAEDGLEGVEPKQAIELIREEKGVEAGDVDMDGHKNTTDTEVTQGETAPSEDSQKDPNNSTSNSATVQEAATLGTSPQEQGGSGSAPASGSLNDGQQKAGEAMVDGLPGGKVMVDDQTATEGSHPSGKADQQGQDATADSDRNGQADQVGETATGASHPNGVADQAGQADLDKQENVTADSQQAETTYPSDPDSITPETASKGEATTNGDASQVSRPNTSADKTPPGDVPQLPGAEDSADVAGDGNEGRRSKTKSATSQGYSGDTVYLTSWDQRTETESVARPETVQTVREDPAE